LAVRLLSLLQSLPNPGAFFLRHSSLTLTAVLVDAGFLLKRAARIYGHQTPEVVAKQLHRIAVTTVMTGPLLNVFTRQLTGDREASCHR
jgi:hypothetical protein